MHVDFLAWKDGEYAYCAMLIADRGGALVGHDPRSIASYLRMQSASAFYEEHYEIAARLATAATALSHDARNDHEPDWSRALRCLTERHP